MTDALRHWIGTALLLPMILSAMYSANSFDLRDRFPPPATRLEQETVDRLAADRLGGAATGESATSQRENFERSQPWWQEIKTFRGSGALTTEAFSIENHAIQWRVAWSCERGHFVAKPLSPAGKEVRRELVNTDCPQTGTAFSVKTGSMSLQVQAQGDWTVKVEQQVDIPLVEAPLPEMSSGQAQVIRTGSVYDVDRVGRGAVKIFRLPGGQLALRLEEFFVSQNSDLELRLSELSEPKSTPEIAAAPQKNLEFLKATTGAMNYLIPKDVDISRYRSLVIWCEITHNAYAAATLES